MERYGFIAMGAEPAVFEQALKYFTKAGAHASFVFGWRDEPSQALETKLNAYFEHAAKIKMPVLFDLRDEDTKESMLDVRARNKGAKLFSFENVLHQYHGANDKIFLLAHDDVEKDSHLYSDMISSGMVRNNPDNIVLVGYSSPIFNNYFADSGIKKSIYTNGMRAQVGLSKDIDVRHHLANRESSRSLFVNLGSPFNGHYGVLQFEHDGRASFSSPKAKLGSLLDSVR